MSQTAANNRDATFAEEALVVDVQLYLHNLMEDKRVSRADLAKAMGVSRARVTQLLSDDCRNLTVRLLARASFALGETVQIDCAHMRNKRANVKSDSAIRSNVISMWSKGKTFDDCVDVPCDDVDDRLLGFVNVSSERRIAA